RSSRRWKAVEQRDERPSPDEALAPRPTVRAVRVRPGVQLPRPRYNGGDPRRTRGRRRERGTLPADAGTTVRPVAVVGRRSVRGRLPPDDGRRGPADLRLRRQPIVRLVLR